MEESEQLVLLKLDLEIPNLWENKLVERFPETSFVIQRADYFGRNSFSGLLTIKNGDFSEIRKFLKRRYPKISLEIFCGNLNLFYYIDSSSRVAEVIKNANCVMSWPVEFKKDSKRIKIILKERDVERVTREIEEKGVKILRLSKIIIDFDLRKILTPKQEEILKPSLKLGYYEFPKRINLNTLARRLEISPSTLCVHLQKIESRILNSNYSELFFERLEV